MLFIAMLLVKFVLQNVFSMYGPRWKISFWVRTKMTENDKKII